jgi:hypothetical protein
MRSHMHQAAPAQAALHTRAGSARWLASRGVHKRPAGVIIKPIGVLALLGAQLGQGNRAARGDGRHATRCGQAGVLRRKGEAFGLCTRSAPHACTTRVPAPSADVGSARTGRRLWSTHARTTCWTMGRPPHTSHVHLGLREGAAGPARRHKLPHATCARTGPCRSRSRTHAQPRTSAGPCR